MYATTNVQDTIGDSKNTPVSETGMTAHQQWRQTEGFKRAEKDHGVRYTRFIGDCDSSVFPMLIAEVPCWKRPIQNWNVPIMHANAIELA